MSDPTIIFIAGGIQTVLLAVVTAALKVWTDRNHAETQRSIEVVRQDVNGKMEKLLKVTGDAREAEGRLAGRAEERADTGPDTVDRGDV